MSWEIASSIANIAMFIIYMFLEWPKISERISQSTPGFVRFVVSLAFLCFISGSFIIIFWLFSDQHTYLTLTRIGALLTSGGTAVMLFFVIISGVKNNKALALIPVFIFCGISIFTTVILLLSILNK